jgi:hypothetical protein
MHRLETVHSFEHDRWSEHNKTNEEYVFGSRIKLTVPIVLTAPGSLSSQGDGYIGLTSYKKRQQAEENHTVQPA